MAHVVMGVNWIWQGVAHDASLSFDLVLKLLLLRRRGKKKLDLLGHKSN